MHLFLTELFTSLDTLAPIIKVVGKKSKVGMCNVYPINNFENLKLYQYLKKDNLKILNIPLNKIDKLFFLIINGIFFLPKSITKKFTWLWYYIHRYKKYSSSKLLKKFLFQNKIKTITFEESMSPDIISKFFRASRDLNIKLIKIPSGLNTIDLEKIDRRYLDECDYYIAPNKVRKIKKNALKSKILYFGSLRYSKFWIKELKIIYKNLNNNRQKFIGILNKEYDVEYFPLLKIKENLEKNKKFKVLQSLKPRTRVPIQVSDIFEKNLLTSEVILNCNYLICSRSSSVLFEGLINNKQIIFLSYLNKNLRGSLLYKYKIFKKISNEKSFYSYIFSNKKNYSQERKIIFNKFLLNFFNEKKLKSNFIKFYDKI